MWQVRRFKPALVAVRNESLINELKEALADLDYKPEIIPGEQGVIEVSTFVSFDSSVDFHKISTLIGFLLMFINRLPNTLKL